MTAVLEYTESLIAPIVIHFLWNGVGAIILGGVSLAEDYPHMFNMVISGNSIYPLSRLFILITYNPIILDGNWIFPFSRLTLGI